MQGPFNERTITIRRETATVLPFSIMSMPTDKNSYCACAHSSHICVFMSVFRIKRSPSIALQPANLQRHFTTIPTKTQTKAKDNIKIPTKGN